MDKPWYRKWFRQTRQSDRPTTRSKADAGDPEAQCCLGFRCASGEGEPQDFAEAARWYRLAADQDYSLAQFNLGIMNSKGQGFSKNDVAAAMWFEKAAQQGDPGAQYNLGMQCQRASNRGLPLEASEAKIQAYTWYHLAAAQGYKNSAAAYETLSLTMTSQEVAEASRRAATFVTGKIPPVTA